MSENKSKITSIEILPKPEGTDFGQQLPVEVKCSDKFNGRVDLRLCFKFNGSKGDAGGNTSVTIKDGLGKTGIRIPLNPDWDSHPAEKSKRPLVEFWYEGAISFEDDKFTGPKIKVPTLESRQDFVFQHITSPSDMPRLLLKGNFVKDAVSISSGKLTSFHTSKPASETATLQIHDDRMLFGKPFELNLPESFFNSADPIHILHTNIDTNSGYMNFPSAPSSSTRVAIKQVLLKVPLANDMTVEETLTSHQLVRNEAKAAGLEQGWNTLSGLTDWGKMLLYETVYGGDIVPDAISAKECLPLLKEFFPGGKFYIKTINGIDYVIFQGYAGLRRVYTAPKYRFGNPIVANLTVAKSLGSALKSGVTWSNGTTIGFVFIGAMDIVKWLKEDEAQRVLSDLGVTIGMDALKTCLSCLSAALIGFGISFTALAGSVFFVVAGGLAIGIAVGIGLNWLDDRYKITEAIQEKVRQCDKSVSKSYDDLIAQPLSDFLYHFEREILTLYSSTSF